MTFALQTPNPLEKMQRTTLFARAFRYLLQLPAFQSWRIAQDYPWKAMIWLNEPFVFSSDVPKVVVICPTYSTFRKDDYDDALAGPKTQTERFRGSVKEEENPASFFFQR